MSSMAQGLVREIRSKYLARTPLAVSVLELIKGLNGGAPIVHDHMAFRTFGANDFGNQSLARIFMDLNYREEGALVFPNKKVNALWYSPPFCDPPLPRLFSSELRVRVDLQPLSSACTGRKQITTPLWPTWHPCSSSGMMLISGRIRLVYAGFIAKHT
mmetsp:Transcript_1169/g.3507  ORF Transcript_1169/g.3507 Transcript_1169/m.3507 type:complete len:158 (-) Transcript_1169:1326-1799(-)